MNIRQAARWAERKDCLFSVNRYTGEVEYLYAAYDINTNLVVAIGSYEKCKAAGGCAVGGDLRLEALQDVCADMDEYEGEAMCVPDACEVREWA